MRFILWIFLILIVPFVVAQVDQISIKLDQDVVGKNSVVDGELLINSSSEISLNENFDITLKECSQKDITKNISLYDSLKNSNLYDGDLYEYSSGNSISSFSHDFSSGDGFVGAKFLKNKIITNVSFDVSGNGNDLIIDVGDNGIDWKFYGDFLVWGAEENFLNVDIVGNKDAYLTRQDLSFDYEGLQGQIDLLIISRIKKIGSPGNLTIEVIPSTGPTKYCFISPQDLFNSYSDVECTINDFPVRQGNNELQVRFSSSSNGEYEVPLTDIDGYYLVRLKQATYSNSLTSTPTKVIDNRIKDSLNLARQTCEEENGFCFEIFKLNMDSGNVKLNNLKINQQGSTVTNFQEVNQEAKKIDLDFPIPLSSFNILTPNQISNECVLEVSIDNEEDSVIFDVVDAPLAIIDADSLFVAENIPVYFDGSNSEAPENRSITDYSWDFGDNKTGKGEGITHTFSKEGEYTIKLSVTDSLGVKGTTKSNVVVGDIKDYLEEELKNVKENMDDVNFDNIDNEEETLYEGLNFSDLISNSYSDLSNLSLRFNDVVNSNFSNQTKINSYIGMANDLQNIKENFPQKIILEKLEIKEGNFLGDLDDIPSYGDTNEEYRKKIYQYNSNNVNVDSRITSMKVDFLRGFKNYLLVEKEIRIDLGDNTILLEDFSNFNGSEIKWINQDLSLDSNNFLVIPFERSIDINYILESNSLKNPESFVFPDIELNEIWKEDCSTGNCNYLYCGDNLCSVNFEDENTCSEDCSVSEPPSLVFIVILIVVLLLIFYIYKYKGPGSLKNLSNDVSVKLFNKRIFTNEKDLHGLESYTRRVLKAGYKEKDVKVALRLKGWTEKQINYVFDKIKR